MAGRKVELLELEIGQLKSDCVEKISIFKKLFSAIHKKIDEKFAIMEEMLEFRTKAMSPEARGATGDQGSGGNPNPIRRGKDQEVFQLSSAHDFVVPADVYWLNMKHFRNWFPKNVLQGVLFDVPYGKLMKKNSFHSNIKEIG
ncbi:hypothetical protein IEQ34_001855 [Dendrobium chrysotoxum]|uniref:Uncharacterized protein n=1 Tax=Dendrobium chrysotoxum TaxID=161865 RepID=A0AAV7HLU4_DENCH|nr:hypothetical protein IEQ34_001855 [Dendrobium chrysotoxum]